MANPLPPEGRLAGVDFGTVRIGIALTDPERILASPWETYLRRTLAEDESYFRALAQDEGIVGWVIGMPIHLSGEESKKSREAEAFGHWLGGITGLPVTYFDERFSSTFARQALGGSGLSRKRKKQRIDQVAAQIILSGYLEWQANQAQWEAHSAADPHEGGPPKGLDDFTDPGP